jgi:hypothetical protein
MTFIVNQDGIVWQPDLGENTSPSQSGHQNVELRPKWPQRQATASVTPEMLA